MFVEFRISYKSELKGALEDFVYEDVTKWITEHSKEYSDFETACFFNSDSVRIPCETVERIYNTNTSCTFFNDCKIKNRIIDIDNKKMIIIIKPRPYKSL